MPRGFQAGLDTLCSEKRAWLEGRRVGLLAHPASVDVNGAHASDRLRALCGDGLTALFGPEHGYFGRAGAGEELGHAEHPAWGIPVYSLYGEQRRPTAEMLRDVDVLVFDLQDIAVRCYTFVTTLRYVMEACAEADVRLVVCDRPVPLPSCADGPLPRRAFDSFVAGVPLPFAYGMTPGETAVFLQEVMGLELELGVAMLRNYERGAKRGDWGPWVSPSPGIRYWETAWAYPVTVFTEAFPALGCGRGTTEPFQCVTAPWIDAEKLAAELSRRKLPGLSFQPCWNPDPGVRLRITRPDSLRPFAAAVHLLHAIQALHGAEKLWTAPDARPEWFDKLAGGDEVRQALRDGNEPADIVAAYADDIKLFRAARRDVLLYGKD